jgi:hypothetical protein
VGRGRATGRSGASQPRATGLAGWAARPKRAPAANAGARDTRARPRAEKASAPSPACRRPPGHAERDAVPAATARPCLFRTRLALLQGSWSQEALARALDVDDLLRAIGRQDYRAVLCKQDVVLRAQKIAVSGLPNETNSRAAGAHLDPDAEAVEVLRVPRAEGDIDAAGPRSS